jgi:hypothetical protein
MDHIINLDDTSEGRDKLALSLEATKRIERLVCPNCHTSPKYISGMKFEYCCQYQFGEIINLYNNK